MFLIIILFCSCVFAAPRDEALVRIGDILDRSTISDHHYEIYLAYAVKFLTTIEEIPTEVRSLIQTLGRGIKIDIHEFDDFLFKLEKMFKDFTLKVGPDIFEEINNSFKLIADSIGKDESLVSSLSKIKSSLDSGNNDSQQFQKDVVVALQNIGRYLTESDSISFTLHKIRGILTTDSVYFGQFLKAFKDIPFSQFLMRTNIADESISSSFQNFLDVFKSFSLKNLALVDSGFSSVLSVIKDFSSNFITSFNSGIASVASVIRIVADGCRSIVDVLKSLVSVASDIRYSGLKVFPDFPGFTALVESLDSFKDVFIKGISVTVDFSSFSRIITDIFDKLQLSPPDVQFCVQSSHDGETRCHQSTKRKVRSLWSPSDWVSDFSSAFVEAIVKAVEFLFEPFFKVLLKFLKPILSEMLKILITLFEELFNEILFPLIDRIFEFFVALLEWFVKELIKIYPHLLKFLEDVLFLATASIPLIFYDYFLFLLINYCIFKKFIFSVLISFFVLLKLT